MILMRDEAEAETTGALRGHPRPGAIRGRYVEPLRRTAYGVSPFEPTEGPRRPLEGALVQVAVAGVAGVARCFSAPEIAAVVLIARQLGIPKRRVDAWRHVGVRDVEFRCSFAEAVEGLEADGLGQQIREE